MADDKDSNKDNWCLETCRNLFGHSLDPKERQIVCKLDRKELEDRYFKILDEYQELKKLSNSQDDKIKRLGTKLMRVTAVATTPRNNYYSNELKPGDKNALEFLQSENSKLKEKITVLKNQILSHRVLKRTSSQMRYLPMCGSSAATTCRSECDQSKLCDYPNFSDEKTPRDANTKNYLTKIEDLEMQRKKLISRIKELENKLDICETDNQKEKIAENVEYIRVWRQLKLQQEKFNEIEAKNASLTTETDQLKRRLEETTKENEKLKEKLTRDENLVTDLEEKVSKSNEYLNIREKDEEIRDLMSEMKILHQHNQELMTISTRFSQIEQENVGLKKKLSDITLENYNLKSGADNEQTNAKALQVANEQLMQKLQELQQNMDTLTIQIKSTPSVHEVDLTPGRKQKKPGETHQDDDAASTGSHTSNYKHLDQETSSGRRILNSNYTETSVQTEFTLSDWKSLPDCNKHVEPEANPSDTSTKNILETRDNNLSPQEMLQLLDKVEINTPVKGTRDSEDLSRKVSSSSSPSFSQSPSQKQSLNNFHETLVRLHHLLNNCYNHFNEIDKFLIIKNNSYQNIDMKQTIDNINNNIKSKLYDSNSKNDLSNQTQSTKQNETYLCDKEKLIQDPRMRTLMGDVNKILKDTLDNIQRLISRQVYSQFLKPEEDQVKPSKYSFQFNCAPTCPSFPQNEKEIDPPNWKLDTNSSFNKCSMKKNCHEEKQIVNEYAPILITDQEGLIEIHILSLHLSSLVINHVFIKNGCLFYPSMLISCEFCGFKPISTKTIKYPELNFNLSYVYRISKIEHFLNYILTHNINFQLLFIFPCGDPEIVADGNLSIKNILDYPQNKIHYIVNMDSKLALTNYGQLLLWIRMSCDIDQINKFKQHRGLFEADNDLGKDSDSKQKSCSFTGQTNVQKTSDIKSNGETDTKEKLPTEEKKEEVKVAEADAVSDDSDNMVRDLIRVFSHNDQQRCKKSTSFQVDDDDIIVIRINRLKLFQRCPLLQDPDVHQLYVEFSFLGYRGLDLETVSIPKPKHFSDEMHFNYEKKFSINENTHSTQRSKLLAILRGEENPNVRFNVVSEPLLEETQVKECVEVGHAFLDLRKHVTRGGHSDVVLSVLNNEETENIGVLKINVYGINSIHLDKS